MRAAQALRTAIRYVRRPVRRWLTPHGLILMYHRIADEAIDPWNLCVTPARFAEHLDVLHEVADVVPLGELPGRLGKRSARPVVALTFDDGYLDNLTAALPALERMGIPATVFIATDWIGHAGAFWWDTLAALVLGSRTLPARLKVSAGPIEFRWVAPAAAHPAAGDLPTRRSLHHALWQQFQVAPQADREQALTQLRSQLGEGVPVAARPMDDSELAQIISSGHVELGAHTMTHCPLPKVGQGVQRREIAGSRERVAGVTGSLPMTFAYPYGEYDESSRGEVERAGFAFACSTESDLVWQGRDRLLMPRCEAPNVDGAALRRALAHQWLT